MTFVIVSLLLVVMVVALTFYQPWVLVTSVQRLSRNVQFAVITGRPVLALTLDDGPDDTVTPQVLEILREFNVKATWFVIGERVEAHPDIFRQILEDGHQTGNHFWRDSPTWRMNRDEFRKAIRRTEELVPRSSQPGLLRPASGWFRPWAIQESADLGYRLVLGSAYTSDPLRPPRRYVKWALTRMARPGAILILHVGPGRDLTPAILPDLIRDIQARGLTFVTLDELLAAG